MFFLKSEKNSRVLVGEKELIKQTDNNITTKMSLNSRERIKFCA